MPRKLPPRWQCLAPLPYFLPSPHLPRRAGLGSAFPQRSHSDSEPRLSLPASGSTSSPRPVFTQLVITALKCHKYDKNIQVTGSAALFYLTNSEYRSEQSVKLRRQVIQVVLNGMESYQEVTVSPLPTVACMLWPRNPSCLPGPQTHVSPGLAWT